MIKNIIFDFDGVIVDSEVLVSKAFSKYFKKFGHSFKEEQFYKYAGNKTVEVISKLASRFQIEDENTFYKDKLLVWHDAFIRHTFKVKVVYKTWIDF